jgi:4-hydroxy-3-methylbut-2-en-1-yl diphosphate synthase IspG/GcpE
MPLVAATRETGSKLAITIANEILRSLSIGGCLSQLLCCPGIGRRASDTYMDHFARVQVDEEEGKQRTEEEISDRQEVAGPDLLDMSL